MKKFSRFFKRNKHNWGLALSGGGTRGFAHVGVIKALAEENLSPFCIAGTSVGSLIGSLYAAGVGTDAILEQARLLSKRDLVRRFLIGSDSENIAKIVNRLLVDKTFDQLSIPFAAVAVDISNGNEVVLRKGNVAQAVSASCSVPVLFKPVKMDGMTLVDGGLLNNMPADVCRHMGADIVIGVDLNHHRGEGTTSSGLLDTVIATWDITTKSTMYKGLNNSDIVIEPELKQFKRTSLDNIDEMVAEGYRAAREKMPEIKKLLGVR